MVSAHHDWRVVGPWYRWKPGQTQVRPTDGRGERPAIQKYDTSDLINRYLKDPQRSLRFGDDDRVQEIGALPFPFPVIGSALSRKVATPGSVRKLFLETHKRFYLVACEIRCEATGFPKVKRDEVGETGFVVRRRRLIVSEDAKPDVEKAGRELRAARVKRLAAERAKATLPKKLDDGGRLERAAEEVEALGKKFEDLLEELKVETRLEGWRATDFEGVGEWFAVNEQPDSVAEVVHPLQPLIPDPRQPGHDGSYGTIYFGLLPVSSATVDPSGAPRFDANNDYEIRCFVRRKSAYRGDCPPLVWSLPTERYRLASHNDLAGLANRPVSVQLPDLNELEAQADALPPGKAASFRMISPEDSSMSFASPTDGSLPTSGSTGGAQICSFAIPLITIVAMFLLQLFLPIVVFLFQLFFLLRLKFCIPPSASLSADVAAAIDLQGEAGITLEIEAQIDASIDGAFAAQPDIAAALKAEPKLEKGKVAVAMATDFSESVPPGTPVTPRQPPPPAVPDPIKRPLPDVTDGLEYEPRKEMLLA